MKTRKTKKPTTSTWDKKKNLIVIRLIYYRIFNWFAVIPSVKRLDKISTKDYHIFIIDMKNYRRLKSEFSEDIVLHPVNL